MKCRILRLHQEGIALPKYALQESSHGTGALVVREGRADDVSRVIKTAWLTHASGNEKRVDIRYEPLLVGMNAEWRTRQGVERVLPDGTRGCDAPSWLCQAASHETPR